MAITDVRKAIETELQTFVATLTPTPVYHNTINEEVKPKDDLWVTCAFYSAFGSRYNVSCNKREFSSTVDIFCFGKVGVGYEVVSRTLDKIEQHFYDFDIPSTDISVVSTSSADSLGGDNRFYGEVISLDFMYYE